MTRLVTLPSGGQVRGRRLVDTPEGPAAFLLALAEGPLPALAVLDGTPPADAIRWVRSAYDRHAIETPWQARWVRGLTD